MVTVSPGRVPDDPESAHQVCPDLRSRVAPAASSRREAIPSFASGATAPSVWPPRRRTEVRTLLRAAARVFDRERRGLVHDADAESVWRELWLGGWALLESVDTDGKRLLVLRRDRSTSAWHHNGLDARERRALHLLAHGATHQQVACDLGVAISTASHVVGKALHKLGFRDRVDFVRHLGKRAVAHRE